MSTNRMIRVFIASPGDLVEERRAFKEIVDELNRGFGRGAKVVFEPLGWEDALSTVGRRPQSVINQDIDVCDVFILVMWRRWGQDAEDAAPYSSYTEEEFYRAMTRFEEVGKPTIFVFFKHIDPAQMADPGPQLVQVLRFRKELERTHKVLHHGFGDANTFRLQIDRHLIGFAEGRCESTEPRSEVPMVPESVQAELQKHKAEAERAVNELAKLRSAREVEVQQAEALRAAADSAVAIANANRQVAEAKSAEIALSLAHSAAVAALDGRVEEARQHFARALDGTVDIRVLGLASEFYYRIGELEEAEGLLRKWLAITGYDANSLDTADAFANLGSILKIRGQLSDSETMHRKALLINEQLGRQEGIASAYGSLGLIQRHRGDLIGAEKWHLKALAAEERIGRQEGIANQYSNLAAISMQTGDLSKAEAMVRKSLAIEERLGRLEGMATDYGNLGVIFGMRGELNEAENMYRRALAIDEKIGRTEGMARQYKGLGTTQACRGDFNGARKYWALAKDLYAKLGASNAVDRLQHWVDELPTT